LRVDFRFRFAAVDAGKSFSAGFFVLLLLVGGLRGIHLCLLAHNNLMPFDLGLGYCCGLGVFLI